MKRDAGPHAGRWIRPARQLAQVPASPTAAALDLRDARLDEGDLRGVDLQDADLRHASLAAADLREANLRGARLNGADLTLADLHGADLRGADLTGAELHGADLRDADLQGAALDPGACVHARTAGARGLDASWTTLLPRAAGDEVPSISTSRSPSLAASHAAIERGRRAHAAGRLGEAERRYREALGWQPDDPLPRWLAATVALERDEPDAAMRWLDETVRVDANATRAAVGAAALALRDGDVDAAARRLDHALGTLMGRDDAAAEGSQDDASAALARAMLALRLDGPAAALDALTRGPLADDPAVRWAATPRPTRPSRQQRRSDETAARVADEAWVAAEHDALQETLADRDVPPWLLQSVLVRALTIGAMEIAARAETRLSRALPEARLWSVALRELDMTAEAITALVRTRRGRLGTIRSLRWLALGAHGPTARVETSSGVYFAKRMHGSTRPAASVAFTHRVLRTMHERGIVVPTPLPDRGGDDVLVFGDDTLALYRAVPGLGIGEDDLDADEATATGALLARIHDAGRDLASGTGRPPAGLRVGTHLLRTPSPGAAWQATVGRDAKAALWLESSGLGPAIEGRLDAIGRRVAGELAWLPPALVHGDLGPGNVLLDGPAAGALDWDLADVDVAVWDLARTLDRCCVHWPARDPCEIRGTVARALLAGYQSVRPLRDGELALLPTLIAASRVDLDASVLQMLASQDPDAATHLLERSVVRLDRAVAGAPEIAVELER